MDYFLCNSDRGFLYSKILILILILMSFPFSPLITVVFCFIYLLFLFDFNEKLINNLIFIITIICFVAINNSREFFEELQLDLGVYYDVFFDIKKFGLAKTEILFGGGWELGWPFVFNLLSIFDLSPFDIVLINNLLTLFLCLIWLKIYGFKYVDNSYRGIVFVSFILFFSIATTNFLQRQALSTAILLFAISNIRNLTKYFLIVLFASFFHLSAILIGALYFVFSKIKVNFINFVIIFFGVLFFRISFYFLVGFLSGIPGLSFLAIKFGYYADVNFQIASLRYPILLFPLLVFLYYKDPFDDELLRRIIFFSCCSYYILLGIPLFSERINFLLLIMYGFFIFLCFKKNIKLYFMFLILYLIYFIVDKSFFASGINSYWVRYDFIGFTPFYYLFAR